MGSVIEKVSPWLGRLLGEWLKCLVGKHEDTGPDLHHLCQSQSPGYGSVIPVYSGMGRDRCNCWVCLHITRASSLSDTNVQTSSWFRSGLFKLLMHRNCLGILWHRIQFILRQGCCWDGKFCIHKVFQGGAPVAPPRSHFEKQQALILEWTLRFLLSADCVGDTNQDTLEQTISWWKLPTAVVKALAQNVLCGHMLLLTRIPHVEGCFALVLGMLGWSL